MGNKQEDFSNMDFLNNRKRWRNGGIMLTSLVSGFICGYYNAKGLDVPVEDVSTFLTYAMPVVGFVAGFKQGSAECKGSMNFGELVGAVGLSGYVGGISTLCSGVGAGIGYFVGHWESIN